MNDLLEGMDNQEVTALIAVDLSAAFDTVDHDILREVIQRQYGISGIAQSLVDSYLTDRTCTVGLI